MSAPTDGGLPAPPAWDAAGEGPAAAVDPGLHWRTSLMLTAAFAAVLLASIALLLPTPYVVMSPGPAIDTLGQQGGHPLISISGRPSYPVTKGSLDLTTVTVAGGPGTRISMIGVLQAWLSDRREVLPYETVFPPGTTRQSNDAETAQEMVGSQQAATVAALTELGIDVPATVRITQVSAGSPASPLRAGDVVESAGGVRVTHLEDLGRAVDRVGPGRMLPMTVRRDGTALTVSAPTRRWSDGRTVLGVRVAADYRPPFDVKINIDNVGGPSAGMMFALGVIDKLTPGDLTGGEHVAGTGSIDADGAVGGIGGIPLKMIGAHDAGARWFLAPAENCDEVRLHQVAGLRVVRVSTLHEAHDAVTAIASGNGTASLPSCAK